MTARVGERDAQKVCVRALLHREARVCERALLQRECALLHL